jgi:hypothetical protein
MRRDRLIDLVADVRINFFLRKYGGTMWAWIKFFPGWGSVLGCCEHGNEPLRVMEGGEFLD